MIDAIQLGSFEGHTLNTDAVRPIVTLISLGNLLLCLSRNTNLESKKSSKYAPCSLPTLDVNCHVLCDGFFKLAVDEMRHTVLMKQTVFFLFSSSL